MENLIVALSNLPCVYPLYKAYVHNDIYTTTAIAFVSFASFVSHLVENHKHGMPGIGFSTTTSYILNRFDVAGCVMIGTRLAYLYYKKYGYSVNGLKQHSLLLWLGLSMVAILKISEYDKYNPKFKTMYIATHCLWHIGIFTTMGMILSKIIY
ncbi:hypothetical protein QJ857_gp0751 [Tupanvirus soda lake]|uniref:Uncharacterized protein n=2 Tax=Tupanvirus TaxID=2094720 RepID=A0A6N1NRZ9_9VIRU|nr:hypothetical protein QJ857_gp0751 [Tupanvirus soda lake]QKU35297.1 hypothetical protein [Tupanvirus soda lake]